MKNINNLIWIDLEMTGLNASSDFIIEIASIVTDSNLNILEEGPVFAIKQSNEVLNNMDEWNQVHHSRSGLINRVKESKIDEIEAELRMLNFISKWTPKGESPLCGNSIHQDRKFLEKYMPKLNSYFHYRNIDVSSFKEVIKRWAPEVAKGFYKKNTHSALNDIRESIQELAYYKEYFFIDR